MPLSWQKQLVQHLVFSGVLKTPEIIAVFNRIDRADFIPERHQDEAYQDYPISIGFGQTISQPTTVAFMFELLDPKTGDIVLDIGSWSGWTTAMLASLVGNTGYVTGVEILPELVLFGQKNLAKYPLLNAIILPARKEGLGIPGNSFDRILVSAGAETFPEKLLDQLKPGWRLVIPVGNSIFLYEKDIDWTTRTEEFRWFVFVPLKT